MVTLKQAGLKGGYLTFVEDSGDCGVTIKLTKVGRDELHDNLVQHTDWNDFDHFAELFQDFLGNGWEIIGPAECGALTACQLIIAYDVERDDHGNLVEFHGPVYWHDRYAVEMAHERLYDDGEVWFRNGK